MEQAQQCFGQPGFSLTDRGYHSPGSINHLMMFGKEYLELIGLPENADGKLPVRNGIPDAPRGINGLVFKPVTRNRRSSICSEYGRRSAQ